MNETQPEVVLSIPDPVGDRYGSLGFISWWDQARVRAATVMVVGAGALGNEVIKGLALMGVGRLLIVDFDTVEPGNLSRCVLFRQSDSGQRKAEVAVQAAKSLNPDVQAQAFHGDIGHDLGLGVLRRMDVIIGCLDNREARLSLNRLCYQIGKPWVDGGIESLMGYARVFWPGRGACYECTLTDRDYQLINLRRSCGLLARQNLLQGKVPTTPTAAAIIGGVQTQEALKIIHGLKVEAGSSFVFNGLTNDSYVTRLPVKEDCLSHGTLDEIIEMPGGRADDTTVIEIVDFAQGKIGAKVPLTLGFDLLTGWRCRKCGGRQDGLRPFHRVFEQEADCPNCGVPRMPEIARQITGEEPFAQQTLNTLGIPPLGMLISSLKNKCVGVELSADAESLWIT